MGNFEKLSVLVIVVIIVMILVVALYTWTDSSDPAADAVAAAGVAAEPANFEEPPKSTPKADAKSDRSKSDKSKDERKGSGLDAWLQIDQWPLASREGKADAKSDGKPDAPPAPPAPAPTPTPSGPMFSMYEVRSGDTLGQIAKDHLGSTAKWPEIVKANDGLDPQRLRPGMKIRIPAKGADGGSLAQLGSKDSAPSGSAKPGGTYDVRRGETLETISNKVYGTKNRWPELWVANLALLDDPGDIREGMKLQLPR